MRKGQHFVAAGEGAGKELVHALLLEEAADRPARQPVEVARNVEADAVAGQQMDKAQAVELGEPADDVRLAKRIDAPDVGHGPLVEHADGDEEQPVVGDQLMLLGLIERVQPSAADRGLLRQLGQRKPQQSRDLDQPVDGKPPAGEHALDAGLRDHQSCGEIPVGHALGFQMALEGSDEAVDLVHGKKW